jgi:hypothetical protein
MAVDEMAFDEKSFDELAFDEIVFDQIIFDKLVGCVRKIQKKSRMVPSLTFSTCLGFIDFCL